MSWVWATFVVGGFAAVLAVLKLQERAGEASRRARECVTVLRNPALSDDEKESALRRHAIRLFVLLGILGSGSALALALPLAVVWVLDWVGVASLPSVWTTLQRLDFLAAISLAGGILWYVLRRRSRA